MARNRYQPVLPYVGQSLFETKALFFRETRGFVDDDPAWLSMELIFVRL